MTNQGRMKMISIDIDPAAYILVFAAVVIVILLLILIFIIRQQIYIKKLYEKMGSAMAESVSARHEQEDISLQPAEEELLSYDEYSAGETATEPDEEAVRRQREEERRHLEEERGKDPAEYYTADAIRDNLLALFDRYKLKSFTMSTSDGLVISSTDPDPEEEAARYSYLHQQGKQPEVPNVKLIGVPYKGGTVIGIVKAEDELTEKELEFIERDIRFILRKSV